MISDWSRKKLFPSFCIRYFSITNPLLGLRLYLDTQLLFFLFLAETHPMKASSSLNREICALPLSFNHSSEMQLLTSDINFLDTPPHIMGFWSGPNPVRGAGKLFQEKPVFLEVRLKKLCDPILIKSLLRCSQTKKIIHAPLYLTTDWSN